MPRSTAPSTPSPLPPRPARSATARFSSPASIWRCACGPGKPRTQPSDVPVSHPIQSGVHTMSFHRPARLGSAALIAAIAVIGCTGAAFAADAPVPNKGDTAWMLVSSLLVLMMSIPGLALFYGGLVRAKNMLSILTQVFAIVAMVGIIWTLYGYSLAFTDGGSLTNYVGGFSKAFLAGIDANSTVGTFSNGVVIPEYAYMVFQMTFAMITPALIVGAFAERMKFSAAMLFVFLWVSIIYFPLAHWVWYVASPDDIAAAAKAVAAATAAAAKAAAQAKLDELTGGVGWLAGAGALDFAGGTVVHINAGIAGLVGALMVGKRVGYNREIKAPHTQTKTMIGASLLWGGWFGFNAGSNHEANGGAALAMPNSFVATAAAALAWMFADWIVKGHPSVLGALSGAVAGLVAVTPAAGYSGPMGAIVLGLVVGIVCLFFCTVVKNALGYDASLDVFGVHCVGGIVGAIGTGILVNPALGGTGIMDYTTGKIADYDFAAQMVSQLWGVCTTLVWSGIGTANHNKEDDENVGLR